MAGVAAAADPGRVVSLRVVVRAPDLDAFIERYHRYIDGDRIFIFTKTAQPIGRKVRFQLQLASGEPLIVGEGTVVRVQPETDDKKRPPGMEVKFVPLDDRSQTLVDFLLAMREGTVSEAAPTEPPVALPPPPPPDPRQRGNALAAAASPVGARPRLAVAKRLPTPPPAVPSAAAAPAAAAPAKPEPAVAPALLPTLAGLPPAPAKPTPAADVVAELSALAKTPNGAAAEPASNGAPPPNANGTLPPLRVASEAPAVEASAPAPAAVFSLAGAVATPAGAEGASAAPVEAADAPRFAEGFGPVEGDPLVPANPFSEVSDGAIEYFVEWSLEQQVGNKREDTASFGNIPMALPGAPVEDPELLLPKRRPILSTVLLVVVGVFIGVPLGAVVMWASRPKAPPLVAAAPPRPAEPPPAAAPPPAVETPAAAPSPPPATGSAPLSLLTVPPGATVRLDGKEVGETPLELQVEPGPHVVELSRDRYATTTKKVRAPGRLAVNLLRPSAKLLVTSNVPNAQVTVKGTPRGTAPLTLKLSAYQNYEVEVTAKNAKPFKTSIYLKPPQASVDAKLTVVAPPPPRKK